MLLLGTQPGEIVQKVASGLRPSQLIHVSAKKWFGQGGIRPQSARTLDHIRREIFAPSG